MAGPRMLEVTTVPANQDHFNRIMAFTREVLSVCDNVGINPIMDGSLAVFAYTRNPTMDIHDVDLNCPESDFPRLRGGLLAQDIHSNAASTKSFDYWTRITSSSVIPSRPESAHDHPVQTCIFTERLSSDGYRSSYVTRIREPNVTSP